MMMMTMMIVAIRQHCYTQLIRGHTSSSVPLPLIGWSYQEEEPRSVVVVVVVVAVHHLFLGDGPVKMRKSEGSWFLLYSYFARYYVYMYNYYPSSSQIV